MLSRLKKILRKSTMAVIAYHVLNNLAYKARLLLRNNRTKSGSRHAGLELDSSLGYIDRCFNDYLHYGGVTEKDLAGKKVLEIGPGDNLGVALLFYIHGASRVVALDKFYSERNNAIHFKIYHAMRERLGKPALIQRFDECVTLYPETRAFKFNPDKLDYIHDCGIEEANTALSSQSFDLIVSRAALCYVQEVEKAFAVMDALLNPGGIMIHKIDLQDVGMFSRSGLHPLTFLTISHRLYRWMTSSSPKSNRKLLNFYRHVLNPRGFRQKFYITHIVGGKGDFIPHRETLSPNQDYSAANVELIEKLRPRLQKEYRNLPLNDLLVSGILMTARKIN